MDSREAESGGSPIQLTDPRVEQLLAALRAIDASVDMPWPATLEPDARGALVRPLSYEASQLSQQYREFAADLRADLEQRGLTPEQVRDGGPFRPCDVPYLLQVVQVNDRPLHLEEYPNPEAAADRLAVVSPSGGRCHLALGLNEREAFLWGTVTVGGSHHWYRAGRLVAAYSGDDAGVLAALARVLGQRIVGP
jgi:hypothetical protein